MTPTRIAHLLTAGSGIAVVILFLANLLLSPSVNLLAASNSPDHLARTYAASRNVILSASYLGSLGWGSFFLTFSVGLFRIFSARGELPTLFAGVGLVGAVAESILILVIYLFLNLAAFMANASDPAMIHLLNAGGLLANNLSGFPTAVCLSGFSAAVLTDEVLPRWLAWLGLLVAVVHLISAGALAPTGVFSPTGLTSTMAPLGMTLWVLGVSGSLLRVQPGR